MDSAQKRASHFPNIFRFITEYQLPPQSVLYLKVTAVSFFSAILLMGISLQMLIFLQNKEEAKRVVSQREQVLKELAYWKGMVQKFEGHRDIYYRIAALNYRLGKKDESKLFVRKALELDPNFQEGRVLGAKVGL